jgi:hypothetical protein
MLTEIKNITSVCPRETEVRPMFASSSALSYPNKTFHCQLCMLKLRKLERCPNTEHPLPVQPKINILSPYIKNNIIAL